MIKKMIDGKEIICDAEEERQIQAFWDFNIKYREYRDAQSYDGASMPTINMDRAKQLHLVHIKRYIEKRVKEINEEIERAQESEIDTKALFAQRKQVKDLINQDLSNIDNMDDLKALLPNEVS
jgi:uncharacterized protein YktA (UPF0223 family)